ncbi:BlaI/MecI/CopY family transcriptional regulator [Ponticaulis sp.]|uniref:BlaI/MecI/CopY family transcriptional regulator n=1 Tax=Ponticaulis sp. TaxID=2020902 RepID=UPI000B687D7B|nr:BlaI/MecI/CopY family transcriptional regulator [Ponticaulis sp.]MAI91926.1 penicillinase repressor [Ponticaulis sp.]OUX96402.1 MAG: penicillinase repressor [Hyphomonadaceae bacterium TMED5]|tara:strand:- start:5069 stop:5449 length:381 start_codon:yes stop_codon:yes gene_type:complete
MKPSDSELILLKPLWQAPRLSAREIHDATLAETNWSYSSTRKTLDRMVEKGLIKTASVHGIKTFSAARPKLNTLAGLIREFSTNILGSDKPLPAAAFVGSSLITQDEIEELEALLAKNSEETDTNE